MKKYVFICLFLLPLMVQAQTITVSEDLPLRNDIAYELIGELKGQTLLFRDQTTEWEVQCFDESMGLSWSKPIELEKKQPLVMGVAASKKDFTILYRHKRKGDTVLKAQKYDPAANMIDSVTVKNYGYLFYTPNYQVVPSEDDSKLLIYYIEKQTDIHALVFDVDSMQLLWEKSWTPEDLDFFEDFRQILVDDSGNVHLILDRDNVKAKKKTHYYEIYEYFYEKDEMKTFNIALQAAAHDAR